MTRSIELSSRVVSLFAIGAAALACGNYGGGNGGGGGGEVVFSGASGNGGSNRTEMVAAFSQTVLPLTQQYCSECHAGAGPGTPHIAHADPETAYANTWDTQKVNLTSPESSRLVRRLSTDFHHCWSDCVSDGAEMLAAIEAWAALVEFNPGGGTGVENLESGALTLAEGFEPEGNERYQDNVIALWEFKEETGTIAHDTSGVEPAIDLELQGDEVGFLSSYGIDFVNGRAIAPRQTSRKLFDLLADPENGSQQYSVEAWVVPANTDQEGPARIISYSNGTGSRNFTLGQVLYNYNFRNRALSEEIDNNGSPALQTYDADQDLQATLQHVVITYDQYRGRRIWVNGLWTDDEDERDPGRLWTWDPEHRFVLGNETSNNRQWEGKIQLVAIYDVPLTEAQIVQNFKAGIGKRLVMRFDVSQWVGSGSYVEFVVSEFDDYSYLFCEPTFSTPTPDGFRVSNIRIAVNGQVPVAGQAFVNVDVPVMEDRQLLSRQCSIVPKDLGAAGDVFTVQFEILGGFENPVVVEFPPPPPPTPSGEVLPDEGTRNFARINATMASLTQVDPNTSGPAEAFADLTESLPPTADLRSFSSSHQVAISKLALEYCDRMVDSPTLREQFFGANAFDFDAPVPTAFASQADRDVIIDNLTDKMFGSNVANQPGPAEVTPILDQLITDLTAGCDAASCPAERTRTVVKGVCAAVLASAGVLVH